MTLPDQAPPRKHHRWFLYAPWLLFALALVAWSGFWIYLRGEVTGRMDAAAARARAAGWQVQWSGRHISGYPFRLEVVLDGMTLAEPSGWGVATPQLRAETFAYRPGHWIAYTPGGVTVSRPGQGPLRVGAKVLRASLNSLDRAPPSLSIEGAELSFASAAGAPPPAFTRAAKLQVYLRPGPDDQGAALFRLDDAVAEPSRWLGRVARGRPGAVIFDGIFSHASSLRGANWADAVRAWTAAGGAMTVRNVQLSAADAALNATSGALTVGPDGRLRGTLVAQLRQAPLALDAMEQPGAAVAATAIQGGAPLASATINFTNGQVALGAFQVGPAPRVF